MSHRFVFAILAVTMLAACAASSTAGEPTVSAASTIDLRAYQYIYADFPRRLRALRDQQALAEAELIVAYNRAASYEPFRRFGRYAATYMADQTAQLEVLAAQQRLRCLHDDVTALWRERQAVAAQMMQAR